MKLKILSLFFVVLIAQTQVAQGSPIGFGFGDFIGQATSLINGVVNTITHTIHATLSLLTNVLNGVVQSLGKVATQANADIGNAVAAVGQLGDTGGSSSSDATEDPVAVATEYLLEAADNVLPIIEDTLTPLSDFNDAVANSIENTTELLSNPIRNINQKIAGLTSILNTIDLFQTGINITYQGAGLLGNLLEPVAVPIGTAISKIATSVPEAISIGLDALSAGPLNIDNVLNKASRLTNALAAQVAAKTQSLSDTQVPITRALSIPVNNVVNAVNSVPAKIKNAITAITDAEKSFLEVSNARRKEIISAIAALDTACAKEAAADIEAKSEVIQKDAAKCVTNEIPALKDYLAKYQDNAADYKTGIAARKLSISSLKHTVKNAIAFKLHLIGAKIRVEGCLTNNLLNFAAELLPLAAYGITCKE